MREIYTIFVALGTFALMELTDALASGRCENPERGCPDHRLPRVLSGNPRIASGSG